MSLVRDFLRARPDFFVVGAIKAGSTSLYQYLSFHSRVESTVAKEPSYYSYNFEKGRSWYLAQFPRRQLLGARKLYFDASPVYLHDPKAPARIREDFPNARLIAVCRDPIDRAVSHYNYYSNPESNYARMDSSRLDRRTLGEAFDDDLRGAERRRFYSYCRLSLYGEQLQRFCDQFPAEQILTLELAELERDIPATMRKIAQFAGIPRPEEFERIDVSDERVHSTESFAKTREVRFRKFNTMTYSLAPGAELEARLVEFFRPDVRHLAELVGRPFSWTSRYLD